jgi:hypothetical protein
VEAGGFLCAVECEINNPAAVAVALTNEERLQEGNIFPGARARRSERRMESPCNCSAFGGYT